MNLNLNIDFLKSQPTVGELRKVTREALTPLKFTRGEKFVARCGNNQYHQVNSEGSKTFYPSESISHSLMPQTFNYTKINNARRDLEWKQVEKELGIIQL
jgi:hypothetical protein